MVQEAYKDRFVMGIFEASILYAMLRTNSTGKFGIITTGKAWEPVLSEGVHTILGSKESARFAGVIGTGLGVLELHIDGEGAVKRRMGEAAVQMAGRGASAICLGCAGMSGLEDAITSAIKTSKAAESVRIVDGVVAGVQFLRGLIESV